jgi:hypothetical protein
MRLIQHFSLGRLGDCVVWEPVKATGIVRFEVLSCGHEEFYFLLATSFMLDSCLAYASTLKKVVVCSSEMSDDFKGTTQRYMPKDRILHYRNCLFQGDIPIHGN